MQLNDRDQVIFGDFRLDLKQRVLERNNQFVRLPPKALQTLVLLVEAHPGLISREDLHAKLWPDSVVDDANLTQYIYVLRKTLGSAPDGRHYIETVARRGYRIVGEMKVDIAAEPVEAAAAPDPGSDVAGPSRVRRRASRVVLAVIALGVLALAVIALGGANIGAHRPHPEALRLYEEGRALWRQRKIYTEEDERYFREAMAVDPKFIAPQIGLADTLAVRPYPAEEAQKLISKILLENDRSAEAHATAGFIWMFHRWDWEGARRHFERSIELDSKYVWAHQWYALWNTVQGRHAEADVELRAAIALEPSSVNLMTARCWSAYLRGNPSEAMSFCREALKINPLFAQANEWLIRISSQLRDGPALVSSLSELYDYSTAVSASQTMQLYHTAYATGGVDGLWRERLKSARTSGYFSAELHAWLGEREEALRELGRACDEHDFYMIFVAVEPAFRSFHDDPRFQKICARVGLKG